MAPLRRLLPLLVLPLLAAGVTACSTQTGGGTATAPVGTAPAQTGQPTAGGPLSLRWLFANAHGGAGVRAAGSLPSAPSGSQAAYDVSSQLGAPQVQALGALLGLTEQAHEQNGVWTVEDGHGASLDVDASAGHLWQMHGDVTAGGSGPPPGCGTSNVSSRVAAAAATRRLLSRVLATTGQSTGHVTVARTHCGAVATAEQHVAGLRTVGYASHVDVTDDGTAVSGYGWFGQPHQAGSYPLVGAARALQRVALHTQTPPTYCVRSTRKPYCHGSPRVITHVQPGLMLVTRTDGDGVLVPAWLFRLSGQSDLLAVVAVTAGQASTQSPSPTG